ncbi:hypothetical protein ACFSR6_11140 [Pedobacter vanadiisoli]|uniref:Uncharacterized protein n=1 Tax=Pedobacter vanadiisoli TaxID=1761975 RepID=A0ABW5MJR5_9SPHI
MKKLLIGILLIIHGSAYSQKLNPKYLPLVNSFIDCIKRQNLEKLSTKIKFPLKREYPIAPVQNKQEFIKRYKAIFDEELTKKIINSKPDADWDDVGWRGIMLFNGDLWLDYGGSLIAVNHQSKQESDEKIRLIAAEKVKLHPLIKSFQSPVLIFETAKYRIRIDDLGNFNYRYTSWPIKSTMHDQPALILKNGKYTPDGSGGNHNYQFKSGDYTYTCYITVMGETGTAPASLVITKNGKEILSQDAKRMTP